MQYAISNPENCRNCSSKCAYKCLFHFLVLMYDCTVHMHMTFEASLPDPLMGLAPDPAVGLPSPRSSCCPPPLVVVISWWFGTWTCILHNYSMSTAQYSVLHRWAVSNTAIVAWRKCVTITRYTALQLNKTSK